MITISETWNKNEFHTKAPHRVPVEYSIGTVRGDLSKGVLIRFTRNTLGKVDYIDAHFSFADAVELTDKLVSITDWGTRHR